MKSRDVGRTFLWAGALFYPIPICLGMLGLVGIAYGLKPADIGGDIVAIGPYIVSHIGLGLTLVLLYVLVILAACYSTIDGASAALSSIVAVDIVKRYFPQTSESGLFVITKLSVLLGGIIATLIVLSGLDFTTLVLDDVRAEDVNPAAACSVHSLAKNQHGGLCRRDRRCDLDRNADLRDGRRADRHAFHRRHQRLTVLVAGLVGGRDFDIWAASRESPTKSRPRGRIDSQKCATMRSEWAVHPDLILNKELAMYCTYHHRAASS